MPSIVGVYRYENADCVRQLLAPAIDDGWRTAWWALDRSHPELAAVTVGEGPGLKLPLLNETLRHLGSDPDWTVVSDDDVRFLKGNVVHFVQICRRAGFDLAQPARARKSEIGAHAITIKFRLSRARRTTFIESGPLFAVGQNCRDRVLPFPAERGMGWGVEIDWYELAAGQCRLGIIDSVVMEHVGVRGYADSEMRKELLRELEERGHPNWTGMRKTLQVWRPWQPRPPWRDGRATA